MPGEGSPEETEVGSFYDEKNSFLFKEATASLSDEV